MDAIAAAGVPLWCGASFDVGSDFLDKLGLAAGRETARIVSVIEETKGKHQEEAATKPRQWLH